MSRSSGLRADAARLRRRLIGQLAGERCQVGSGEVALTFDDGPDPKLTPRLLDALGEAQAPATFFVVGERALAHPELLRRMVAEGHSVGTHTMRHGDLRSLPARCIRREVGEGRRAVERSIGAAQLPLFRPPMGRMGVRAALILRAGSYESWSWTLDSYDWKREATTDGILQRALEVGDGGVVLMHDTCSASVEAAPLLVSHLRQRGLRPVAL